MPPAADVLARLASTVSPDGGWGYVAGQPVHLEPSCLAVVALAADPAFAAVTDAGWKAIRENAQPDGSYRLTRGRPQAAWPTALALFAAPATTAAADKLLTIEGRVLKTDPEVADMSDIDVSLMGWPWAEGNFSWVEPTAWACLALRLAGRGDHPRVKEGMRLLIDRSFDSGGSNYGNRQILGKMTEPIPGPTAITLLALQGVDDPRVEAAKGYLRVHASQTTDLEHVGWIKLALACHATDSATRDALPGIDARIRESLGIETSAGPLRLALAALALHVGERNPFRIDAPPQVADKNAPRLGNQTAAPSARPLAGRIGSMARGVLVSGLNRLRPLPFAGVHIGKCDSYDGPILDVLKAQFAHFRPHLPPLAGKRVVLKPNLVEYRKAKVINTDPRFVDAVIQLFKAEGAGEIVVAEGPGHWRNVRFLVNESGLGEVLRKHNVPFVDINHDEPVKELNLGRCTGLDYLYVSRTIKSADVLVSLPKLKTHHWAAVTLSLKNLFGTLPGICYGWPKNELHWRGIANSIVDIALTTTPHLAIVDGIVGMEGDGPLMGSAKPVGAVVMGADLVAVDSTCCRLMGIPPERVETLMLAASRRLGVLAEAAIPQFGESIASLAQSFELPPGMDKVFLPAPAAS